MGQHHSTRVNELELAELWEIEPLIILGWVHKGLLRGVTDEVGLNFEPGEIDQFEEQHGGKLLAAQRATERLAKIKTSRRALDAPRSR